VNQLLNVFRKVNLAVRGVCICDGAHKKCIKTLGRESSYKAVTLKNVQEGEN
jgi:hypothetical protein